MRMKLRAVTCCMFLNLLTLLANVSVSSNRVTLGRKACLALLAPLAMDYKESK